MNTSLQNIFLFSITLPDLILWGAVMVITALAVSAHLLWRNYRNRQRYKAQLAAYRQEYDMNALHIQLHSLSRAVELRDKHVNDARQKLLLVNLEVEIAEQQGKSTGNAGPLVREVIEDLRRTTHAIEYDSVARFGLETTIRNEIAPLQKSGKPNISFVCTGEPVRLREKTENLLYGAYREAVRLSLLQNDLRVMRIVLRYEEQFVSMAVMDDATNVYRNPNPIFTDLFMLTESLGGSYSMNDRKLANVLLIEIPLQNA